MTPALDQYLNEDVKSQWLAVKAKLDQAMRHYDKCSKVYDSTPKGTPEFIAVQKACWSASKAVEDLKAQEEKLRKQLG